MKKLIFPLLCVITLWSCKNETKDASSIADEVVLTKTDTIKIEVPVEPIKRPIQEVRKELKSKGFKTYEYVDETTQDTILMQQYFMAILKKSPIHMQNEEENQRLHKLHLEHLTKMYNLGYADITGPFTEENNMQSITIYNVPTLKMADSLVHADPMVKAERLEVEIHPWWGAKGFSLR